MYFTHITLPSSLTLSWALSILNLALCSSLSNFLILFCNICKWKVDVRCSINALNISSPCFGPFGCERLRFRMLQKVKNKLWSMLWHLPVKVIINRHIRWFHHWAAIRGKYHSMRGNLHIFNRTIGSLKSMDVVKAAIGLLLCQGFITFLKLWVRQELGRFTFISIELLLRASKG